MYELEQDAGVLKIYLPPSSLRDLMSFRLLFGFGISLLMYISPLFTNSKWAFNLSCIASFIGAYISTLLFTMLCAALKFENGNRQLIYTLNSSGVVNGGNDLIWLWTDYQRTAESNKKISIGFSHGESVSILKKHLKDDGAMLKAFIDKRKTLEDASLDKSLDIHETPRSQLGLAPMWFAFFQLFSLTIVYHKIKDLPLNSSNLLILLSLSFLVMFFVTILRSGVPYKKMLTVSPDGVIIYKASKESHFQWSDFSAITGNRSVLILKIDDQNRITFDQDTIGYANIYIVKLYAEKYAPDYLVTLDW